MSLIFGIWLIGDRSIKRDINNEFAGKKSGRSADIGILHIVFLREAKEKYNYEKSIDDCRV